MTEAAQPRSVFETLNAVDCKSRVAKKGKFSYLSWSFAVDELLRKYPEATWEVKRFDGPPYMKTDLGYFVEVAVTINGVTRSQIHPILGENNKPIDNPNAFQVNTSIQRCLTKAIALHGLGLYIYNGEDVPSGDSSDDGGGKDETPGLKPEVLETMKTEINATKDKKSLELVFKASRKIAREKGNDHDVKILTDVATIRAGQLKTPAAPDTEPKSGTTVPETGTAKSDADAS
jgi:hypothetical protein